jgi:hypothetical protein
MKENNKENPVTFDEIKVSKYYLVCNKNSSSEYFEIVSKCINFNNTGDTKYFDDILFIQKSEIEKDLIKDWSVDYSVVENDYDFYEIDPDKYPEYFI